MQLIAMCSYRREVSINDCSFHNVLDMTTMLCCDRRFLPTVLPSATCAIKPSSSTPFSELLIAVFVRQARIELLNLKALVLSA